MKTPSPSLRAEENSEFKIQNSKFFPAFILFFSLLLAAPAAHAQNATWSGNSTWGVWGIGSNWIGGSAPLGNGTATFSNTSGNQVVMAGAALTAAGLVFNNTGTTVLEGGGGTGNTGLTLGAGGITVNAGAGAVLIGYNVSPLRLSVTLNATQTWTNNSSYTLTEDGATPGIILGANTLTIAGTGNTRINPVISGTGSLIKTGAGILTLNGASTYTGTTTISGGTLQIGMGSSTGALAAGSAISNNGTLVINRSNAVTQGTDFSSAGVAGSTGNFTQAGLGTTTLNAANSYSGTTTVLSGTLTLNATTGSLNSASALTFNGNGGTFNMDNTGAVAGKAQSLGALTFTAGEGIVKTTRTAAFNEAITFASLAGRTAGATGNFFANGNGTNSATNGFVLTGQAAGFIDQGTFFGGGTSNATYAYMNAAGTYVRGLNYGTDSNTSNVTVTAATIGNPGSAYNVQVGNVAITGQTTTQISTLQLGTSVFTLTSNATLTVNGILKAGNTNGNTINGTTGSGIQAANNSELVIRTDQASDTLTISTPILDNGSSSLTKSGAGTLTLSGNNTYTGTTTVLAGTLAYGASNALSSGNVTVTGGGVLDMKAFSDSVGAVTVTGQGIISGTAGVGTLTGTSYSLYTNYATDTTNGITISAILGGNSTVGLTKTGGGIAVLSGANTYTGTTTISEGSVRLGNGGTTGSLSPSSDIVVYGDFSINRSNAVAQGMDFSSAAITGTGSFTQGGSGTTTLTAANTFSGKTAITAGTLAYGTNDALGSGGVEINGFGTLNIGAFSDSVGVVLLATGNIDGTTGVLTGTAYVLGGTTNTVSAILGGAGTTLQVSSTTTTLTGANTFTGNTTITAGTLQLGNGGTTGSLSPSSAIALSSTASLTINRSNAVVQGMDFSTAAITGTGSFIQAGTGTTTLNATNTYSGATTVLAGTLALSNALAIQSSAIDTSGNGTITLNGPTTLTIGGLNGSKDLASVITTGYSGLATLTLNPGSGVIKIYSGVIDNGAMTVTKSGLGTQVLSGANTYTGNTTITAGTLQLGNGGTTGNLSASSAISNNATLAINRSDAMTQGTDFAAIAGSGALTQAGTGTTTLTANNTYTGLTTVSAGTLQLNRNTGNLSASSALTFNVNGGTFNMDNTGAGGNLTQSLGALTFTAGEGTVKTTRTADFDQKITFASLAARSAGAVGNFVNSGVTNSATNGFVVTGKAAGFIDKGIFYGGSAYASMNATGTYVRALNYSGDGNATTSSGNTTLASIAHQQITGAISAQNTATFTTFNISGANNLTLASAQTVTVDGILKSGSGNATISGGTGLTISSGAELVIRTDLADDRLTISNNILANGTNALTKSGAGTLTLSGANTYNGTTTVLAGTLAYGASNALSTGAVTVNGGTLAMGTYSDTVGAVTLASGSITGSTGVLTGTSYSLTNSGTVSAILGGAVALTKTGLGTVVLSGANTYTGTTTVGATGGVNAGLLQLSGSGKLSNAATTVYGGTLDLNGTSQTITTLTLGGGASGSAANVLIGSGNLTLGGDITYTATNNPNGATISGAGIINLMGTRSFTVGDSLTAPVDLTVSAIIANGNATANGVSKAGAGTMILSGANTYTGITTIGGVLIVSNIGNGGVAGNIGQATNVESNINLQGTLQYTGTTASTDRLFRVGATAGTLDASGSGTISFSNNGTLGLSGSNTPRTLTLTGTNTGNNTLAAVISDQSASGLTSLTKSGVGTWVLTGNNTYTGVTLVTTGTLVVNGSLASSSVTVSSGAKIGGSGRLTNATIGGAGMVGPGSSPGILTASQVDPSGGLGFNFEYTVLGAPKWSDVTASNNDVMRLTNAVPFTQALSGSNAVNFYLNVASLSASTSYQGGFFTDQNSNFLASVTNAAKNFYVKGDGTGSVVYNGVNYYSLADYNTHVSGTFAINLTTLQIASADFATGTVTNGWTTELNVVPEPTTWALLAFSLTTVMVLRRRRNS